jgi:potassium efflux system protein
VWLLKASRLSTPDPSAEDRLSKMIRLGARVALVVFPVALIGDIVGFLNLSHLLGHAMLGSAYLAVTLYAVVRIFDVLILLALNVRPLSLLGIDSRHHSMLWEKSGRLFEWLAIALWTLTTLDLLSIRGLLWTKSLELLNARGSIGSINLSLGNVLAFLLTVWAAILFSRIARFVLEEDVYPRFDLPHGLPYAISTLLHYLILFVGFVMAIAALGFDMTKFTILAGAFGVGVGFGTQNIINNFVSGLILLFERPIKVGDVIQVDDATGVVQRIGIRATVVRTANDSDVIVPNGSLISNRVTNWTTQRHQHMINTPVSVSNASDPQAVIALLKKSVAENKWVSQEPPPQAFFLKPSPGTFDFEVHAWTTHVENLVQVRSDLAMAIYAALAKEKVVVP